MKQTYNQYLRSRVEFNFLVGMWVEFDVEVTLKFEEPSNEFLASGKFLSHGDLSIPCMQFSSLLRKSPKFIVDKLKPHVEGINGIEKVESVSGYLNFHFDRIKYLSLIRDSNEG
jgi:arginyl-tRNA synthetase